MVKLSEEDKNLLYILQMRTQETIPALAKLAGETEHSTRRRLGRLQSMEILHTMPILNLSVLGYSRFKIIFSTGKNLVGSKTSLFNAIKVHPQTLFLADVGGDGESSLIAIAKNLEHLNTYLRSFSNKYEGAFSIKEILPILGHCFIGTRELAPSLSRQPKIEWREVEKKSEIDSESSLILYHYCNSKVRSLSELSRLVKIPQSTLTYRLTAMEKTGLIAGYFNAFDPVDLGMFPFHIYLSFRGLSDKLESQLYKIALDSIEVDLITRHIGPWDFALLCFVKNARALTPFTDKLSDIFKEKLAKLSIVPQFNTYLWTEFNQK
jgi:DNA-binding Lrp family transcriptional regulator